jgi:hypothetical protein
VQSHEAWGLGLYSAFRAPVILDNTVESAIDSVPQTGREAKTSN